MEATIAETKIRLHTLLKSTDLKIQPKNHLKIHLLSIDPFCPSKFLRDCSSYLPITTDPALCQDFNSDQHHLHCLTARSDQQKLFLITYFCFPTKPVKVSHAIGPKIVQIFKIFN